MTTIDKATRIERAKDRRAKSETSIAQFRAWAREHGIAVSDETIARMALREPLNPMPVLIPADEHDRIEEES